MAKEPKMVGEVSAEVTDSIDSGSCWGFLGICRRALPLIKSHDGDVQFAEKFKRVTSRLSLSKTTCKTCGASDHNEDDCPLRHARNSVSHAEVDCKLESTQPHRETSGV
jgi:hypothetical protein